MDPATSKLSALIVGIGSIGERHLRCFQASQLYSVAGCELNAELGQTIAEKYSCPVYSSLDEALSQGDFDMAVICTLANSHIPIATACVKQGLHVLIEKPLAISLDGIAELENLAIEKQRIARVAYVTRAMPSLLDLRELLTQERLGKPRHVTVSSGQHFPSFRPAYRTIYYNKHETGGGGIQDALTHQLHTVEWLVSPILRLFASASHQVLEGVEVEDTVNLVAVLEDGTLASIAFNQFQAPDETTIQINGTLGSALVELHNQRLGVLKYGDPAWTWIEQPPEERDTQFIRQAAFFFDEIAGKRSPLANLREGLQTLKVNRAALESASTHREVVIE